MRPPGADDLPGSDLVAEPTPQGPRHRRRAAARCGRRRNDARAAARSPTCSTPSASTSPRSATAGRTSSPGGQCQRISIARSLVLDPELLICDEPVSALDVSVQAQILNLLKDAKERYGLTMVFIAHDLGVVQEHQRPRRRDVPRQAVRGRRRPTRSTSAPAHPYTAALLESVPVPDPGRPPGRARASTAARSRRRSSPPSGCRFRTRCPRAADVCAGGGTDAPARSVRDHFVACHFPLTHQSPPPSDPPCRHTDATTERPFPARESAALAVAARRARPRRRGVRRRR